MNAPLYLRPILSQKLSVVCESVLFCGPLGRPYDQLRRLEANASLPSDVPKLLDPHRDLHVGEFEAVAALDERLQELPSLAALHFTVDDDRQLSQVIALENDQDFAQGALEHRI